MKLDKSQRHTAYIICLYEFEQTKLSWEAEDGFCYFFFHVMGFEGKHGGYNGNIDVYFPELVKRKPKFNNWLWFGANKYGGTKPRIKILNKAIEETSDF